MVHCCSDEATGLGDQRFEFRQGQEIFLVSQTTGPAVRSAQPSVQHVSDLFMEKGVRR